MLFGSSVEPWHNLRSGPAAERHHESFAVCGQCRQLRGKDQPEFPEHAGFRPDLRHLHPDADQILHPAQGCPEIGNQPF